MTSRSPQAPLPSRDSVDTHSLASLSWHHVQDKVMTLTSFTASWVALRSSEVQRRLQSPGARLREFFKRSPPMDGLNVNDANGLRVP